MIKSLWIRPRLNKFYAEYHTQCSNYYQINCRIYLDEYPEQKELREECLKKWYYWENIKKKTVLWKQKQEINNIQTNELGVFQSIMNKFLKRN